jgi:very-short-patch-repair endonuclease
MNKMTMTSPKQIAHCRRIASKGGKARAAMPNFQEHNRRIAPLGWAATCAKYGPQVAARHLRQYRLDNPSSGELTIMEILDRNGIAYVREEYMEGIGYIDFLIWKLVIAVEDGIHRKPEVFGDRGEEARYKALLKRGYRVLIVDDRDINEQKIMEAINDLDRIDF